MTIDKRKVIYTICIGSNEHRKENLALARERLIGLFPGICFSDEMDTEPLFFQRPDLFSNQVARFTSEDSVEEITLLLKSIEREAGRTPEDKQQEIVRLDIDLLSCDDRVFKPKDLKREYVLRGLKELEQSMNSK